MLIRRCSYFSLENTIKACSYVLYLCACTFIIELATMSGIFNYWYTSTYLLTKWYLDVAIGICTYYKTLVYMYSTQRGFMGVVYIIHYCIFQVRRIIRYFIFIPHDGGSIDSRTPHLPNLSLLGYSFDITATYITIYTCISVLTHVQHIELHLCVLM